MVSSIFVSGKTAPDYAVSGFSAIGDIRNPPRRLKVIVQK
jgi:hypothetical protein